MLQAAYCMLKALKQHQPLKTQVAFSVTHLAVSQLAADGRKREYNQCRCFPVIQDIERRKQRATV